MTAEDGITAQISFGMDNHYKCELEVWGSEGCILIPRIFTPTAEMRPTIIVRTKEERTIEVSQDDQFAGSINHFLKALPDDAIRRQNYAEIAIQASLIAKIRSSGIIPGLLSEKTP
jgi:predicted dehydrogenase